MQSDADTIIPVKDIGTQTMLWGALTFLIQAVFLNPKSKINFRGNELCNSNDLYSTYPIQIKLDYIQAYMFEITQ